MAGKPRSWDPRLVGFWFCRHHKEQTGHWARVCPWSSQIPGLWEELLSFPAASKSCHQPCLPLTCSLPCSRGTELRGSGSRVAPFWETQPFLGSSRECSQEGLSWSMMWLLQPHTRTCPPHPSPLCLGFGSLLNYLELSLWSCSSPPLASFSLALTALHRADSSLTFRPQLTHHLLQAAFPDPPKWARCLSLCFLCWGVSSYILHCDFSAVWSPHSRQWGPWRQQLVLFSIKFPLNPHLLALSGTEKYAANIYCIQT